MKRKTKNLLIILLMIFSFYYTNHISDFIREIDPIMKQIKKNENKFNVPIKNATINGDTIELGQNGYQVQYKKSFQQMKKYGAYNETLMVLEEVEPDISINNHYDKFIVRGNPKTRRVSLVFLVEEKDSLENIIAILKRNNIIATFFIDGSFLEKNTSIIRNNSEEWEIKDYKGEINSAYLKTAMSYLETITKEEVNFCYGKDQEEIIKICSKMKIHTIKPDKEFSNKLYYQVKTNLENGMIIPMKCNSYIEEELNSTIKFIQRKGYKIVKLSDLITEKVED